MPIGFRVGRLDDLNDRQVELGGELEIARVMRRHGHDCAGAVAGEHVVGNPDGNLLAVDRIDGVSAGEHAGFFLRQFGAFQIGFFGNFGFVIFAIASLLFRRGDLINELVFRRQHHVSRAKQRVGPRGEHADSGIGNRQSAIGNRKIHFRAFAAANPVPLHFLERIAPVNRVEVVQQFLGVGGDAEHPLAHRLADDGKAADFALAVHDFFVGQHRAELFAPPDRRFADVGETFGIAIGAAFGFECSICACLPIRRLRQPSHQFRRILQRLNRLGLVRFRIEPRIVELQENPLRPLEIIRVGGGEFARPVVAEAEDFESGA